MPTGDADGVPVDDLHAAVTALAGAGRAGGAGRPPDRPVPGGVRRGGDRAGVREGAAPPTRHRLADGGRGAAGVDRVGRDAAGGNAPLPG
ncbi:hypothetical protein V2I01_38915 [Micromonospora sp. BRA006-A]|nr:hypothetical protein [Micromonospora sp. BRA006-A]